MSRFLHCRLNLEMSGTFAVKLEILQAVSNELIRFPFVALT